ncbi:MAG: hypothetical protein WBM46_11605 [Polyangiales bacterium]
MKKGIFVALAALALAVFAVPDAQAWWHKGPDLRLKLSGSTMTISTENGVPTPNTQAGVAYGSGITKGSGSPIFVDRVTYGTAAPDGRCPANLPFGADLTTVLVFTYHDGSIIELSAGEGSFFCTDGVVFDAELQGTVVGGEGRFDGASGTWDGSAEVDGARLTGDVAVDLD